MKKKNICPVLYFNLSRQEIIDNYDKYDFSEGINVINKNKNITNFKCIYCEKKYNNKGSLETHIKRDCKNKREIVNTIPIKLKEKYAYEEIKNKNNEINELQEKLKILNQKKIINNLLIMEIYL